MSERSEDDADLIPLMLGACEALCSSRGVTPGSLPRGPVGLATASIAISLLWAGAWGARQTALLLTAQHVGMSRADAARKRSQCARMAKAAEARAGGLCKAQGIVEDAQRMCSLSTVNLWTAYLGIWQHARNARVAYLLIYLSELQEGLASNDWSPSEARELDDNIALALANIRDEPGFEDYRPQFDGELGMHLRDASSALFELRSAQRFVLVKQLIN